MNDTIKNTIKGILFFAILLILLNPLNQIYQANIYPNDRRTVQEKQFEQSSSETKIIAIGSSHTQTGFDPTYIQNSFNLGLPGEDIIKNYYRLKYILDHNIAPLKTILLEIDMHRFYVQPKNIFNNRWFYAKYIPLRGYIELSTLTDDLTMLDALNEKIRGTYPVIGKGTELLTIMRYGSIETNYSILTKGHLRFSDNFSKYHAIKRKSNAINEVQRHFSLKEVNQKLIDFYKKFLKLAQHHDIQVILIRYPITQEYLNETRTYIPNITTIYEKTIEQINAQDLLILNYQNIFLNKTHLFHNSDHLNKWGAEVLSKQIDKDLKNQEIID